MKLRAIIVEDEENSSQLMKHLLSTYHADVQLLDCCSNADNAILSIFKYKPNLIFLDIQIPGMSGLELIEKLNDLKYPFQTIITTAYAHPHYFKRAVQLGLADYLLKPILREDLAIALENAKNRLIKANKQMQQEEMLSMNKDDGKISLNTGSSRIYLDPDSIVYANSDGKYSRLFLTNKQEESVMHGIGELSEILTDHYFHKIDRFTIVNRLYVHKISPRLRLITFNFNEQQTQLSVSHAGAMSLLDIMENKGDSN